MKQNNIHFIGIGGIGMSGLAEILLSRGKHVTGSDLNPNDHTRRLLGKGAQIEAGHASHHIPEGTELVVRSSCIRSDNPEIVEAVRKGVKVVTRGELLMALMDEAPVSVAVTGTHGKTTTSSIIAHIMESGGVAPTSVIGGTVDILGSNARDGKGNIIVAEVDESDGFFRNMASTIGVITNIEREHMENYGSMENLIGAYKEFSGRISSDGVLIYNGEDDVAGDVAASLDIRTVSFGIDGDFDVKCDIVEHARSIGMDIVVAGNKVGSIKSPLIGRHNVMNILAAIAVCLECGMDIIDIARGLFTFTGAGRRFEQIGVAGGVEVVEDYAHHPTELAAIIRAAKAYTDGRVVAVFQPHRHSRTHDLADDFVNCFDDSDLLILTDVYSAHEDDFEGVGIKDIYARMDKRKFEFVDLVEKENVPDRVAHLVRKGDIVLILGAGDIREVGTPLLDRIEKIQGSRFKV